MQAQYRWLAFLRDLLRRNVVAEDSYFEFLSVWVVAVRGLCRRDMRKVSHGSSEKMAYCAKQGGM